MGLTDSYEFRTGKEEEYSIDEYLDLCKKDPDAYASPAERMLSAIGEPEIIDTKNDEKLSRIFQNRIINRYPSFGGFYGMEDVLERIVSFYRHAAQGLEEKKQILYLLGPVGGGKSSIAERLKTLMEKQPIYVLKNGVTGQVCPNFESPLGLFHPDEWGKRLLDEYKIPTRYLHGLIGPWTIKRLHDFKDPDGKSDLSKFRVVKIYPSKLEQIAITKTEPGDENNQDISSLVGKTDLRMLDKFSQYDADSYAFSGALCKANQGIMEFVEMFKAPIKVLHPLLTATQEGNFMGTEALSAIPFHGNILAHSNESEWEGFKNNPKNEAFLDRIYIVKVPYCLRATEEVKIYKKLLRNSSLAQAPCAPATLEMMAQFSILSRLHEPENSNIYSKMKIYDGENLKDTDPQAKSILEYKQAAGVNEGMSGLSTRFAYKVLSQVFNYDPEEIGANPVHLIYILEKTIEESEFPKEKETFYLTMLKGKLQERFKEFIGKEIQTAYLESYSEYGQNLFDRYIIYSDHWIQNNEFVDPNTGERFDRNELNSQLEKVEKPAQIVNPKEFRNEIVNFSLRYRAKNKGKNPNWTSYEKMKEVIEQRMFSATEELLPVISFTAKGKKEDQKKHEEFVNRMVENGYTKRMVRLLVEWYLRVRKSS